jgi:SecD/SecF fusion protein
MLKMKLMVVVHLISGGFDIQEATDLSNVLKTGKLPASARIIEEEVVGASLGSKAISAGFYSMIASFILIIVFMIVLLFNIWFNCYCNVVIKLIFNNWINGWLWFYT